MRHLGSRRPLFVVSLAAMLSGAAMAVVLANQVFRGQVEIVRLDVSVTRGGQHVMGLGREDFEVFDNGVRQAIDVIAADVEPLSLMLAMDVSASVTRGDLERVRAASFAVLQSLKAGDRIGLLSLANPSSALPPTPSIERIRSAVADLREGGDTALMDGVYAGALLSESGAGRPITVVLTDGVDTSSFLTRTAVLNAVGTMDGLIYGLLVGRNQPRGFLHEVCEATGGTVFKLETVEQLETSLSAVMRAARQRYLLSYTPRDVTRQGWHRVEVRIRDKAAVVRSRPGYRVF